MSYRRHERTKNMMLGFDWVSDKRQWEANPQMPFKPCGLMLWDLPPRTMLSQSLIGMDEQILASHAPIPADFFTTAKSYDQLMAQVEAGLFPPSWPTFDSMTPMVHARIVLLDAEAERFHTSSGVRLCMWGVGLLST